MKEKIIDISITIGLLEAEIDSLIDAYKNCKFSALKREYSTQLVSHKQALKMLKQAADHEPLINQEVEKRIAETVAGKFIAVEIEKRIADRQLTDEQIERQFTTSHYHYEKGHYYKVRKDRIFGAKWYRDRLVSQMTEGGGE